MTGILILTHIGLAVGSVVGTWLVLRNNPKFLYRHMERRLRIKLTEATARGAREAHDKIEQLRERLRDTVDDIL